MCETVSLLFFVFFPKTGKKKKEKKKRRKKYPTVADLGPPESDACLWDLSHRKPSWGGDCLI